MFTDKEPSQAFKKASTKASMAMVELVHDDLTTLFSREASEEATDAAFNKILSDTANLCANLITSISLTMTQTVPGSEALSVRQSLQQAVLANIAVQVEVRHQKLSAGETEVTDRIRHVSIEDAKTSNFDLSNTPPENFDFRNFMGGKPHAA